VINIKTQIEMSILKTFKEYLNEGFVNEGKIAFLNKMKFTFTIFNDRQGMALQFIPDSKTLEFPKTEVIEKIQYELNLVMPEFASTLWYESNSNAAGFVFRVDTSKLVDVLIKNMK
jgi:hypothetical protein